MLAAGAGGQLVAAKAMIPAETSDLAYSLHPCLITRTVSSFMTVLSYFGFSVPNFASFLKVWLDQADIRKCIHSNTNYV